MSLIGFSAKTLTEKFEKMSRLILGTPNISGVKSVDITDNEKYKLRLVSDENNTKVVFFPETLIDIVFAELLINAKKSFPNNFAELYFELHVTQDDSFEISILNNFKNRLPEKAFLRISKNNVKYNTNGLGLVKRITGLLSDKYAIVKQGNDNKYEKELFQVSITIKNLQNE